MKENWGTNNYVHWTQNGILIENPVPEPTSDEEADEERDELEEEIKKIHDLEKLSFDGNHVFEDGDDWLY